MIQVPIPADWAWTPKAGEMLTCIEDSVRAAAGRGVNQLRDGERQFLRKENRFKKE
jgi:hypothetical protein